MWSKEIIREGFSGFSPGVTNPCRKNSPVRPARRLNILIAALKIRLPSSPLTATENVSSSINLPPGNTAPAGTGIRHGGPCISCAYK